MTEYDSSEYDINAGTATQFIVKLPGQTHVPGAASLATAFTGTIDDQNVNTNFVASVMAVDSNYNVVTSYTGSTRVSLSGAYEHYWPTPSTVNFVNGVADVTVKHYRAMNSALTPNLISGTALSANPSATYTILPGAATKIIPIMSFNTLRTGAPSRAQAVTTTASTTLAANSPTTVDVYAVDDYFNIITSETGTAAITTTDANDTHPASAALVSGGQSFSVTPKATGTHKVQVASYTGGTTLTALDGDNYTVDPAPPVRVEFSTLPSVTAAADTDFAVSAVVRVLDADNVVNTYANPVRIDVFTDSGCSVAAGGTLSVSAQSQVPTNGYATFSNLAYRRAESVYFKASSAALTTQCTPAPTVVSPGTASQIVAILPGLSLVQGTTQNANTAITGSQTAQTVGTAFDVEVKSVDSWFNVVTSDTRAVSASSVDVRDTDPASQNLVAGSATFSFTNTTATSSGVTHYINPSSNDSVLSSVNSKNYTVNTMAVSQLLVLLPGQSAVPGTQGGIGSAVTGTVSAITAGSSFNVTVQAVDAYFNKVASTTGTVELAMAGGTDPEAIFPGSASSWTSGQAVIAVTNITGGNAHALRPTASLGLTQNNSTTYTVSSSTATQYIVILPGQTHVLGKANCVGGITGPADDQTAGTQFQVTVRAVDNLCNTATAYSANVSVTTDDARDTNPGTSAMSSGSMTVNVTNTSATSAGVTHYVRAAYVSGGTSLTAGASSTYTVNTGSASRVIAVLPGQTHNQGTTGNDINTAITGPATAQAPGASFDVVLKAVDNYWNTVSSFTGNMSLTLQQGTDSRMTITGAGAAVAGEKTFTLTHYRANNASNRRTISPAVDGYIVRPAAVGIAGTNAYDSKNYYVNPGSVTQLIYTVGQSHVEGASSLANALNPSTPSNISAGSNFTVNVKAVDANFNVNESYSGTLDVVTNSDSLDSDPGTITLTNGVASFVHNHEVAGTHQFIGTNSSTGIANTNSQSYSVVPSAAYDLLLSSEPSGNETTDTNFAYAPQILIRDIYGNQVTSDSSSFVTMTAYTNSDCTSNVSTASYGATANPKQASGGAVTFSNLFYRRAETIYLKFTSGSLVSDCTTTPIVVNPGSAYQLAVVQPGQSLTQGVGSLSSAVTPSTPTARTVASTYDIDVYVVDEFFNVVTGFNTGGTDLSAQLRETGNVNWEGYTPNPTNVGFTSGHAIFSGLENRKVGTWRWFFSSTSTGFTRYGNNVVVNHGVPFQTVVLLPGQALNPGVATLGASLSGSAPTQTAGTACNFTTKLLDKYFNVTTTLSDTATITTTDTTDTNPTGVAISSGTVTTSHTHTTTSASYTAAVSALTTYSSGLTHHASTAYNVIPAGADNTQSDITVIPTSMTAGDNILVTLTIKDQYGNAIPGITPTISVTPSTGVSSSTCSSTNASGVSTCNPLITKAEGKTFAVTSPAGISKTDSITVNHASANKLAWMNASSLSNEVAGVTLSDQPSVEIRDVHDNLVSTGGDAAASVTLQAYTNATCTVAAASNQIRTNTSASTTVNSNASGGQLTFANLNYIRKETIYFKASATLNSVARSSCTGVNADNADGTATSIVVKAAASSHIVFTSPTTSQSTVQAGVNISSPALSLEVRDAFENVVESGDSASAATMTLTAHTDSSCSVAGNGTLRTNTSGGVAQAASVGLLNFANVNYTKAETIYFKASSSVGGFTACSGQAGGAPNGTFSYAIQPNATIDAAQSLFTLDNTAPTAGATVTANITAYDAFLNPVPSRAVTLSYSGGAAPAVAGESLTTSCGTTNASGVTSCTFVPKYAITRTVTATVTATALSTTRDTATVPAASSRIVFTGSTGSRAAETGVNFSTQPAIKLVDTYGNTVTSSGATGWNGAVTLTAWTSSGCASGQLSTLSHRQWIFYLKQHYRSVAEWSDYDLCQRHYHHCKFCGLFESRSGRVQHLLGFLCQRKF